LYAYSSVVAVSNIWTIENLTSGITRTAEDWFIENITGSEQSLSTGNLSLPLNTGFYDDQAEWSFRDRIRIFRDGEGFFEGIVISTPRTGSPDSEAIAYQVASPWWYLENTTYLQEWAAGEPFSESVDAIISRTVKLSHAQLFVDSLGNAESQNDTLQRILAFIGEANIPIAIGTLPINDVTPWPSEVKDTNIANAIRRAISFSPNVSSCFDYSVSPPVLNFITRTDTNSPILTLNQGGEDFDIVSNSIRAREDRVPSVVALKYEFDDNHFGTSYRRIEEDNFPANIPLTDPLAVHSTVRMRGAELQNEVVSVRTTKIPDNPKPEDPSDPQPDNPIVATLGSNADQGKQWWKRHFPAIDTIPDDDVFIEVLEQPDGVRFSQELPDDIPVEPLFKGASTLGDLPEVTDYPRELLEGGASEWMGPPNMVASRQITMSARVYYSGDISSLDPEIQLLFGITQVTPRTVNDVDVGEVELTGLRYATANVSVQATNLVTKNYTRTTSAIQAQEQPQGVARHFFEQLQQLHYDGQVVQVKSDGEVPLNLNVSSRLNINGSNMTEWETMDAHIQQVSFNIGSGEVTYSFGAPDHLSIQDLVQLLSINRENELRPRQAAGQAELEQEPEDISLEGSPSTADKSIGARTTVDRVTQWNSGAQGGSSEVPCTALRGSVINIADPDQTPIWHLRVGTGIVQNLVPEINDVSIGDDPQPTLPFPTNPNDGDEISYWLTIEHEPNTDDITAGGVTRFSLDNGGLYDNAEIVLSVEDPSVIPTVDSNSGVTTDGLASRLMGRWRYENGTWVEVIEPDCGDFQIKFCAPDSYMFIPFDGLTATPDGGGNTYYDDYYGNYY